MKFYVRSTGTRRSRAVGERQGSLSLRVSFLERNLADGVGALPHACRWRGGELRLPHACFSLHMLKPPGLAPQPLTDQRTAPDEYFLLNNKAVNQVKLPQKLKA